MAVDAGDGVENARSMLGDLGEALTKVARQMGEADDSNRDND
ncbi:hypothetical protein ACWDTR_24855 [Streptomyces sp. NPDC003470]